MKYNLNEVINNIDKLPELFFVALKVAKMLNAYDMDVNVQELAKIISLDQSLTTHLLRLCNSAHYGFSKKIVSINDAVTKLGIKVLKSLVFVAVSQGVLNQDVKGYGLEKGELWKNSVSCAVYSKKIAEMVKYSDPETAFTAGLLRDIGKLMIHEYVGISYSDILATINKEKITFLNAEQKVIGFDHCQIGSEMAKKWNFPTILTDVIQYHHSPELAIEAGCEDLKLISIVHIADSLTMMLGSGM